MSRFGVGIRRGVMAGDQFTQIANGLFRDTRLSYRAKGAFGYVSTHRDGWQVTIAGLVRLGPDGREAVRAALGELERHGYLVRERLRRPDGTLGEIVYCITDRPAVLDAAPFDAGGVSTVPGTGQGSTSAEGIRRGAMAGDQFTRIANTLFRDTQLSLKAKGLFGLLSTHRDGWRMTVAGIARRGRDGEAAVKSGLRELERRGFLVRERERESDGTLGAAAYVITDRPGLHRPRPQPESGFPPVDNPTSAHRPTKNTIVKKTNNQDTRPLRPCNHTDAARTTAAAGRTGIPTATALPAPPPPADAMHPGIQLLLEIAAHRPELLLTGKALTDQGRVASVMMDAGWSPAQLRHVITGRPLPHPVRTSVGAIVAARLRAAQAYPPPTTTVDNPTRPAFGEPLATANTARPSTESADRTVPEALTYRALVECAGCGVPATAPGEDCCPACLGWPPCRTCPGPTPRRARPDGDGRCTTCTSASTDPMEGRTS
ncbi:hypothetical protein SAMN05216489_00032 [Streptomyces sp. 3213]|nr:hypothetical protein [Streptomyces sp. 3213.3]SEC15845.1 hypothetical protein SAMN05216489_00032 [Streptomyces sp. 3213] [Streptomyces sp. 3213.3]